MIRPSQRLHSAQPPALGRAAATLLLLQDSPQGMAVLISQRAAKSSFVPSMYVFPGGQVDASDGLWAQIWHDAFTAQAHSAAWDAGLRSMAMAAIRECFEEVGVLLAHDATGTAITPKQSAEIDRQQALWPQLQALGWRPSVAALALVCHRAPPASFTKRFHTAFFYAAMPAGAVVQPDMHEQINAVWLPLQDDSWHSGERYPMIAPTLDTLHSTAQYPNAQAALHAARSTDRVPYFLAREVYQQGQLERLLPGDLAYAEAELIDLSGQHIPTIDWQYQRPVALSASVQRLTCANPSAMTGPGTNTYLVGSAEQGYVVLDAGPRSAPHLRHIMQATSGHITALVCTHSHPDHSPGAELLQRYLRRLGRPVPLYGMPATATAPAHSQFQPSHPVGQGFAITLAATDQQPAITLRCHHTPGHASNHLCVLLEEDGLLFSGDQLLSGTTTVIAPPDGNMQAYLDSLDQLDQLFIQHDVQYILPAHGRVLGGFGTRQPRAHTQAGLGAQAITHYYRQHRLGREAQIITAMQQLGLDRNDAASRAQLLPVVYADAPQQLWPMAEGSLAAHMDRILHLGLLAGASA